MDKKYSNVGKKNISRENLGPFAWGNLQKRGNGGEKELILVAKPGKVFLWTQIDNRGQKMPEGRKFQERYRLWKRG